jgi:hypothetical protein
MGPFYCPNDRRIYLDTSFFRDIQQRFRGCSGKACEFAEAYVIAHEVGHHVQNLLGILPQAQNAQHAGRQQAEANRIQVRVELQADCLAGVWANNSNQRWKSIEPGDVEAAMQTAAAIGDDRLQQQSRGYVVPDAFTHGSSAQRQRWFMTGLREGKVSACNTFLEPKSNWMPGIDESRPFLPLNIAVLTVSDTREETDDKSGATLMERIRVAGHVVAERAIVRDEVTANPSDGQSLDQRINRSTSLSPLEVPGSRDGM